MWTLYIYISVPCGLALCTRRSRYRLDHHTKRIDPAEGRPRLPCRAARGIRLSHHSHGHADRASHQRVGKAAVHALAKDQPCGDAVDKRRRELDQDDVRGHGEPAGDDVGGRAGGVGCPNHCRVRHVLPRARVPTHGGSGDRPLAPLGRRAVASAATAAGAVAVQRRSGLGAHLRRETERDTLRERERDRERETETERERGPRG